jgi:hypothetical protein
MMQVSQCNSKNSKYVVSQTELELTANVGGSDVTTASVVTRKEQNLQIQKIIFQYLIYLHTTVKTLKTTHNSVVQTDTNFNVRRHFTATLSSNGDATITAGTNETFASLSNG